MSATSRRRGSTFASRVVAAIASSIVLATSTTGTATAAEPTRSQYTATWTQSETVTITETATVDGVTGTGEATATSSATVTATAYGEADWVAYYYAYWDAYVQATAKAKAQAEAQARPVAKRRAEEDARAKATAAAKNPAPKSYTASWTQEETVTVDESATIDGFTGTGRATATASASATVTHTAATEWEAYYWAFWNAYVEAGTKARAQAEAKARPVARQRAEDDARAKAAAARLPEYTATMTAEKTVTIRESFTIGDVVGHGEATVTSSATVSHTQQAATLWEAYYWAVMKANEKAEAQAQAEATRKARAEALQKAEADARAKVAAEQGTTPTPGGTPNCGPEVLKEDGTPWKCTLSDDFRGTELNRDLWVPQLSSETGPHAEDCYVDDASAIKVGGGVLSLTQSRTDAPFDCQTPKGPVRTQWKAAQVKTFQTFGQAYGRFEFRAKMPDTKVAGSHSALWLWPENQTTYGLWPHSGEIDIAEVYSRYPDRSVPMLHYNAPMGSGNTGRTNNDCVLDPSQWNTYVAEWDEEGITISYSGTVCLQHKWNALAPLTGSQPFDQPFMVAMTQVRGVAGNAATAATPSVNTMMIDYVRVWS